MLGCDTVGQDRYTLGYCGAHNRDHSEESVVSHIHPSTMWAETEVV